MVFGLLGGRCGVSLRLRVRMRIDGFGVIRYCVASVGKSGLDGRGIRVERLWRGSLAVLWFWRDSKICPQGKCEPRDCQVFDESSPDTVWLVSPGGVACELTTVF